ncbi:hypothetical protein PMAYCL1PPCAC_03728, partial [Pristionchus mayeri]
TVVPFLLLLSIIAVSSSAPLSPDEGDEQGEFTYVIADFSGEGDALNGTITSAAGQLNNGKWNITKGPSTESGRMTFEQLIDVLNSFFDSFWF